MDRNVEMFMNIEKTLVQARNPFTNDSVALYVPQLYILGSVLDTLTGFIKQVITRREQIPALWNLI